MRTRSSAAVLVAALRPKEWIKNVFVLAPVLFAGRLDHGGAVRDSIVMTLAFCAISSAGYLVNDILDVEEDRAHPVKRYRPIASGELSPSVALLMAGALGLAAIGSALTVGLDAAGVVLAYAAATAAYSILLKHEVILDVMTIAGLFLLRVLAGSLAAGVKPSQWLLFCTGMLALFLGFTKRRQEAVSESRHERPTRVVLEHYTLPFLDQMVSLVTAAALISYGIYAINSPLIGGRMLLTTPIVLYGLFRYLYLIYARGEQRDIAALVTSDRGLIGAVAAYAAMVLLLLYV
ncbi:MAG TPA: decaprenyl-phosphate phosphoribosyltransferase [Solirubrobacteraceae bacterium]|nr:decaprenyl-phosphate phosphoribosyltransferase [Solirubrobacteraceae bacterium]